MMARFHISINKHPKFKHKDRDDRAKTLFSYTVFHLVFRFRQDFDFDFQGKSYFSSLKPFKEVINELK